MFVFLFAGIVVDVGQRVQFVDHDIDIVAADAMRLTGNALSFIHTRYGVEFTRRNLVFNTVKVGCYRVDTSRVTNENHLVSQKFRLQVKVKTGTVTIDDEFRFGEMLFCHSITCF